MALTTSGIAQAREIHSKIVEAESSLTDLKGVLDFMNSNAEFSNFVSGTSFGGEYYEKWGKMLNLISGELVEAVVSMNTATQRFLEQQENNNNRILSSSSSAFKDMGKFEYVFNNKLIEKNAQQPIYEPPGFRPVQESVLK